MRSLAVRFDVARSALGAAHGQRPAAAPCGGDFGAWLQGVKAGSRRRRYLTRTIQSALGGVTYVPEHYRARPRPGRISAEFRAILRPHGATATGARAAHAAAIGSVISRIETQFGVPATPSVPQSPDSPCLAIGSPPQTKSSIGSIEVGHAAADRYFPSITSTLIPSISVSRGWKS